MTEVTKILNAIEKGDVRAVDELLPAVCGVLRHHHNYCNCPKFCG